MEATRDVGALVLREGASDNRDGTLDSARLPENLADLPEIKKIKINSFINTYELFDFISHYLDTTYYILKHRIFLIALTYS